jgi:beta-phosphoglucomutase
MERSKCGKIGAVIFDLDGVIVTTDECHYEAWKRMADEEGIYFEHSINERLRGVSRMESLRIILERSLKEYSEQQKLEMSERKNNYYKQLIQRLTPADILPGVEKFISELKERGIKVAIGSSSKNTSVILERIGLHNSFDAVVDGNSIKMSKPDPEVFLKASEQLGIKPENCLVVEDADAGIEAAVSAGMKVLAVGAAAANQSATFGIVDLLGISNILFS